MKKIIFLTLLFIAFLTQSNAQVLSPCGYGAYFTYNCTPDPTGGYVYTFTTHVTDSSMAMLCESSAPASCPLTFNYTVSGSVTYTTSGSTIVLTSVPGTAGYGMVSVEIIDPINSCYISITDTFAPCSAPDPCSTLPLQSGTIESTGLAGCGWTILLPDGTHLEVASPDLASLGYVLGETIGFVANATGGFSTCMLGTIVDLSCLTPPTGGPTPIDSCICTSVFAPVCDASTGYTYINECFALCAGVPPSAITICDSTAGGVPGGGYFPPIDTTSTPPSDPGIPDSVYYYPDSTIVISIDPIDPDGDSVFTGIILPPGLLGDSSVIVYVDPLTGDIIIDASSTSPDSIVITVVVYDSDGTATTYVIYLKLDNSTKIHHDLDIVQGVQVYPIPAKDMATLEVTTTKIGEYLANIIDINGKRIWSKNYTLNAGKHNINLPISELESGIYFVSIADKTVKLIINK